jgi:hypothetical protein
MSEKDLSSQLAAAQLRIAQLESQIADSAIGSNVAEAAVRYRVRSEAHEDFSARVRKEFRVENGELVPRQGGQDFDAFVQSLQTRAPHLFADTPAGRQSASVNGVRIVRQSGESLDANPWQKGIAWNLTKQARLIRTNPTLAAKMAKEAGQPMIPGA